MLCNVDVIVYRNIENWIILCIIWKIMRELLKTGPTEPILGH